MNITKSNNCDILLKILHPVKSYNKILGIDMIENISGFTGELGVDGILSPEQYERLNRIQEDAAETCATYLENRRPGDPYPLVHMATGIGKGNIIHRIIEQQIHNKPDSRILVAVGAKTLLVGQTHTKLAEYRLSSVGEMELADDPLRGEYSFLYRTGKIGQENANVHIATIQTIQSEIRRERLRPHTYNLAIVDEVHNIGTIQRKEAIHNFSNIVGLTATAYRYSGDMKTPEDYGFTIVSSLSLPEAQRLGLLPSLVGIQISTKDLLEGKVPVTDEGVINYRQLEKILKKNPNLLPTIADRIVKIISSEGKNYKTVIAVNFVWEAVVLARCLRERGVNKVGIAVNEQAARRCHTEEIPAIGTVDRYKLPEENDQSLQVLISPYRLAEGFDAPATEVLVWASPTDSSLRYTQFTGRLARRCNGKRFGVLVDCLYLTDQYNWSYNMGMWMKDSVQQLDNGLLFLGPERDIESLKRHVRFSELKRLSDKLPLDDLQKAGKLEVQEDDFELTADNLRRTFRGNWKKSKLAADTVIREIRKKQPITTVVRRGITQPVNVVTNRHLFLAAMVKHGMQLRDPEIEPVQKSDFVISAHPLREAFSGKLSKTSFIASSVLENIKTNHPELVANRESHGQIVPVVTDRSLFIRMMLERGAVRASKDKVQEGDFVATVGELEKIFIRKKTERSKIQEVISEYQKRFPEFVVTKLSGKRPVPVATDQNLLIQMLIERGLRLKGE